MTAVSFVGLTTSLPAVAATFYNVLDLGTLSGDPDDYSTASGINDLGQVIGSSNVLGVGTQLFRTAPNSPINPATDNIGARAPRTTANDINNLGQVVGITATSSQGDVTGFVTEPNGGLIEGNTPFLEDANGINDSGQIAGRVIVSVETGVIYNAVRYDSNNATNRQVDLGTLGGTFSNGYGINNLGQVVGDSFTVNFPVNGENYAFRTAANSPINAATDDLGTLGGSSSTAYDINDLG